MIEWLNFSVIFAKCTPAIIISRYLRTLHIFRFDEISKCFAWYIRDEFLRVSHSRLQNPRLIVCSLISTKSPIFGSAVRVHLDFETGSPSYERLESQRVRTLLSTISKRWKDIHEAGIDSGLGVIAAASVSDRA